MSKKIFFLTLSILAMVGRTSAMQQDPFSAEPIVYHQVDPLFSQPQTITVSDGDRSIAITIMCPDPARSSGLKFSKHSKHLHTQWRLIPAQDMYHAIIKNRFLDVSNIAEAMRKSGGYPRRYFNSVSVDGKPLLYLAINTPRIYRYLVDEVGLDEHVEPSLYDITGTTIEQLYEKRWGASGNLRMDVDDDQDDDEMFDIPFDASASSVD